MDTSKETMESRFAETFGADLAVENGNSWISDRRRAMESFQANGFPKRKSESYKYTPVSKRLNDAFPAAQDIETLKTDSAFASLDGIHLSTRNGLLRHGNQISGLPAGLTIASLKKTYDGNPEFLSGILSSALDLERDPFSALAAASASDGVFIHVESGVHIDETIVIHHDEVDSAGFVQPRLLIVAEKGASVNMLEHFGQSSVAPAFENRIAEALVEKGARVDHVLVYERNENATFVNGLHVTQADESHFSTNTITLGGGLVRNNLHFLPDGEECETHLNGLYIARGNMHVDNHTIVDHAKPNCVSNELFKGIVTDKATGVFNGKVLVRQDAQKINAYQTSKSIVLDRNASIYAKPELEIYADDVKCSHGATTGELDDEALFYLRARGINYETARMMLLEAFARDVVDLIELEGVREYLYSRLHEILLDN